MALKVEFKPSKQNKAVLEELEHLWGEQMDAAMVVIDRFLLKIWNLSKTAQPRVPVDTGALQGSIHALPAKLQRKSIIASIQAGGASGPPWNKEVDYAVITHEDMNRKYRRPEAGPKYIEAHLLKHSPELEAELIEVMVNGGIL